MNNIFKLGVTLNPSAGSGNEFPTVAQLASPIWPLPANTVLCAAFGTSNGDNITNYADVSNPLSIVGTPTIGSSFATVNATNGFSSNVVSSENVTMIMVCNPLIATTSLQGALPLNAYGPGSNQGDSIGFSQTNLARAFVGLSTGMNQAATLDMTSADTNDLNFFVAVGRTDGSGEIGWAHDGGAISWSGPTGSGTRLIQETTFKVGLQNVSGNFQASVRTSVVLVVHRAMSRAEISDILTNLRTNWAPQNGVTTL